MARIEDDGRGPEASAPRPPTATPERRSTKRKGLPWWQELVVLLGTALVLAVLVKTFFVQAFYIPSGSMEPTLNVDDRILVQKVSYWAGDVQRGDIVVFDDPGGWLGKEARIKPHNAVQRGLELFGLFPTGGHLVKRVIGVPGDHVRCCNRSGSIVVNGVPLDEDYLPKGVEPSTSNFNVTVPDDRLWVMGDNRPFSSDSRAHTADPGEGYVPADDVVGKVWAVVWPGSEMRFIERPEVFDDTALDGNPAR